MRKTAFSFSQCAIRTLDFVNSLVNAHHNIEKEVVVEVSVPNNNAFISMEQKLFMNIKYHVVGQLFICMFPAREHSKSQIHMTYVYGHYTQNTKPKKSKKWSHFKQ